MKNSRGVSLIALIITIIVIIILAAIVMNASTSTVGNAQYARFAQEFGEFTDQVALDAANVKSQTGIKGQIINDAQMFFMTANGFANIESASGDSSLNEKQGVAGYTMPVGYVLTNMNEEGDEQTYPYVLQKILNIGKPSGDKGAEGADNSVEDQHVAYVINDGVITNYAQYGKNGADASASHEFYGDSNGKEYHFVTSNGQVFTLPGYPVPQSDGSIEYHIDSKNGHYYVVAGNSGKSVGETNVNNDYITNVQPSLAAYLSTNKGINATTGEIIKGTKNEGIATDAQQIAF